MFLKITTLAAFLSLVVGESPDVHQQPKYSSAEAVSSQSFIRHDVPLSYRMSATHPRYESYHSKSVVYITTENPGHVAQSPSYNVESYASTSPKYQVQYVTQNPKYIQSYEDEKPFKYATPTPSSQEYAPQTFGTQSPQQAQRTPKPFHYTSQNDEGTKYVQLAKDEQSHFQPLNTQIQSLKSSHAQEGSYYVSQTQNPQQRPDSMSHALYSPGHSTHSSSHQYYPVHSHGALQYSPSQDILPKLQYSTQIKSVELPYAIQQSQYSHRDRLPEAPALQYYPSQEHFNHNNHAQQSALQQIHSMQYASAPISKTAELDVKQTVVQPEQYIYPQQLIYQGPAGPTQQKGALYMVVGADGAVKRFEYQPQAHEQTERKKYTSVQPTLQAQLPPSSPVKYAVTSVKSSPLISSLSYSQPHTIHQNLPSNVQSSLIHNSSPILQNPSAQQYPQMLSYHSNALHNSHLQPEYVKAAASESFARYYQQHQKQSQGITPLYPVRHDHSQ